MQNPERRDAAIVRDLKGKEATLVVLPDLHAPHTDGKWWDWMLGEMGRVKPDIVVQIGDWIDADPANLHPTDLSYPLEKEYTATARQSREIRSVVPKKCKLVRHIGNHDWRLEPDCGNVPKRLRGLTHWTRFPELQEEWSRWHEIPYVNGERGSLFRCGQIVTGHGWQHSKSSWKAEALDWWSWTGYAPHTLVVRGHQHAPHRARQVPMNANTDLPLYSANPGCAFRSSTLRYTTKMDTSKWGCGLLVVKFKCDDPFKLGKAKQWDAELLRPVG